MSRGEPWQNSEPAGPWLVLIHAHPLCSRAAGGGRSAGEVGNATESSGRVGAGPEIAWRGREPMMGQTGPGPVLARGSQGR